MKKARGTGDTSAIALRDAHATDPARSPEDRSTPVRLLSGTTTPTKDWGPPSKTDAREVVPPPSPLLQANGNLLRRRKPDHRLARQDDGGTSLGSLRASRGVDTASNDGRGGRIPTAFASRTDKPSGETTIPTKEDWPRGGSPNLSRKATTTSRRRARFTISIATVRKPNGRAHSRDRRTRVGSGKEGRVRGAMEGPVGWTTGRVVGRGDGITRSGLLGEYRRFAVVPGGWRM